MGLSNSLIAFSVYPILKISCLLSVADFCFCSTRDHARDDVKDREQIITEWLSRFLGEDECTQNLCGHVDPAFLFSSQASTKIKGPESQFGTRILGFYILTMWIR